MSDYYKLEGKVPMPSNDFSGAFGADRKVANDEIGDAQVSTIFLVIDHNFGDDGPPLLFETMVFGGPLDESQERYSTWAEAVAGHARWVEKVKATQ